MSLYGGKDSTALAIYMRQRYPQLRVEYIFCDTGCELPETYEYLERLEALLGLEVQPCYACEANDLTGRCDRRTFESPAGRGVPAVPQPAAFKALAKGCDAACPRCRRQFQELS